MKSRIGFAVFAVALLCGSSLRPAAAASKAVTWTVNHAAKTITVEARLYLYPGNRPPNQPADPEARRKFGEWKAQVIRDQILSVWNAGYTYRCYKLVFKVDVVFDDEGSRFTVPGDRVGIRISSEAVGFRSFVTVEAETRWDGSTPSDRVIPANSFVKPTTWSYPGYGGHTYAHEFGHVLGLSDAYIEWKDPETGRDTGASRPLAPDDLMSTKSNRIDQTTIDRLVQRSGEVKDYELKCGWRAKFDEGGVHMRGVKCGGYEGRWEFEEWLDVALAQKFKFTADIGPDMKGTWSFWGDIRGPLGGASGTFAGQVVFAPGPPATLSFTGNRPFKMTLEPNVPECEGK